MSTGFSRCIPLVVFAASLLAVSPVFAQGPAPSPGPGVMPESPFPEIHISVNPVAPIGPAADTGHTALFGGLGFSGGYNFTRRSMACIGVDGQLVIAGIIDDSGWDSYFDTSGTWIHFSAGLPIRLGGGAASFFARPGICFDSFNFEAKGVDPSDGDYDRFTFDSAPGIGICLAAGLEVNIGDRFSIGFMGQFDFLFLNPHELEEYWADGGSSAWSRDTHEGYVTPQLWFRFLIKF